MIKINLFVFALSLFVGLFLVYVTSPKPKIILKYPNLKNVNNSNFVDENNNCVKFSAKEVSCSPDK
jgi:hypothetical protein